MKLRKKIDKFAGITFFVNAVLAAGVLFGILLFLFSYGVRAFIPAPGTDPGDPESQPLTIRGFLFGTVWNPDAYGKPHYGIIPLFLGSFLTTLIALIISVPLGIAGAIFIAERLTGWVRIGVKMVVELFAGFPSVVIGLFGLVVLAPIIARTFNLSSGLNLFTASIILALMSLPTIISVSEDALRVVPHSYREAAYALGASPWTTAIKVILPAARSGILAAVMLGFGRAIGETMAVLMVAGNAPIIPRSLFDPVRTITTTLAIELGETAANSIHFFSLFALGFVLFVIALATNLIAESLIRREKRSFTL
ncbi:MAG: phosphate ABC transporter permease subunit PstC [candidate division WOR-3 bacterium]|nr:phosphate ABC transporter permease subunit PstC [candidate division WOR-3 bacterium]MCR4423722.1 phosphate ABC transporter permease subunit PstC [candidate division WOR-3 bacterium]MDH7519061.1 phosphate ABC transporter permease subunit PstC [bacterium]